MDKRVFRLALLTIISAFILVLTVIYAANSDRINKMFGKKNNVAVSGETVEPVAESSEVVYGQQIGDDLKSFMYDDSFFDETEKIPSVVVIQKKTKNNTGNDSSASMDSEDSEKEDDDNGLNMAIVGELDNPDALEDMGAENASIPDMSINPNQNVVGGTPVGNVP